MARWLIDLWNAWEIQILVLLSFTLQVVLLLFAGIRRHEAYPVLRLLLWLAYQLADSTAIYALGHLSLSGAPRGHQLVVFWAQFLLLHLGGPDNITAYSLEDNKLWKRHLLTVVVQVLGAAYVLYNHITGSGFLLEVAIILMFIVGILKYGERTWALKCSNMGSIRSSLKKEPPARHYVYPEYDEVDLSPEGLKGPLHVQEELLVRRAHSVFHICKRAAVDSSVLAESDVNDKKILRYGWKTMWRLVEMDLSLLYDILYTKAAVIHTLPGYCIRVISVLSTIASLLLFHFSGKDLHSTVDVAITYILMVGAFFLEMISLLGALGSSWTLQFLYETRWIWLQHAVLCSGRWGRVRHVVVSLRRLLRIRGSGRRWPDTMGQYNLLCFCSQDTTSVLHGLMKTLGLKDWWDKNSWTIDISDHVKELLHKQVAKSRVKVNTMGIVRKHWGEDALGEHENLKWYLGVELQEGIITWHIGTDVFLGIRKGKARYAADDASMRTLKAIREISNYMMFLLVKRPYMLPGLPQNWLYQVTCDRLVEFWRNKGPTSSMTGVQLHDSNIAWSTSSEHFSYKDDDASSPKLNRRDELAKILYVNRTAIEFDSTNNPRLPYAVDLGHLLAKLPDNEALQLLLNVWTDILFYVANRCSRESHAKKLSNGGELTTVIWLMAENNHNYFRQLHRVVK